ncbi:phage head-tail adapter protein [Leptotrichia massiliensis]|uniref:phage head-tail adapter protein n=1 Tax=Leptotrichia massiliensis TaxID=1852388 RepID=UPI0028D6ED24|nr:phage head-tail adapter protein [Leptotrichia massiliensis]
MNKFFKLLLLFTSIIAIGLFYKNHLKKARINLSDCPNNRYMANRKEYYEKNYKIFKEKQIKFYIDDKNGKMREIANQDEFFASLREAIDYAYEIVGKKWFYTKRKLFGIAFGIDKEAKIKYISVPEKEKKNILKNIDKYPEKNIENRCVLIEVLKGNY